MSGETFYVTSPIYYVNDTPHIGHAYTTLACDVVARYHRSLGKNVYFLTGTDEHGQKVEKAARDRGVAPETFTDQVSGNFRTLAARLGFSNDDFIRTTEKRHHLACAAFWNAIVASGDIYLGKYAGWYAVRDEAYYDESELTVGSNGARIAPSGAVVEWVEEASYFFRLSRWQQPLLEHYQRYPDAILPKERRNEVMRFIEAGLRDLSVSRTTFRWGVRVPGDDRHVMYVWLDALTNYLTALGYPASDSPKYQQFWPADLHVVGKDILRFHAVYWPAFLMSAGLEPPRRVYAHGWWTNEGQKISKTLGNVIDPFELVETFGLDQVRYFLMREVPFGLDGDFTRQSIITRINHDLANDYGNLCQRVLTVVHRNNNGLVPQPGELNSDDQALWERVETIAQNVHALMKDQQLHTVLAEIWLGFSSANVYIDRQAPWVLRKTDPPRMATVLYVLMEALRRLTILVAPFMPGTAEKVFRQIGAPSGATDLQGWSRKLLPGAALPPTEPIFPRFEEEKSH